MVTIINVADLKDPNDEQGRSYREVNHARRHEIPLGTLVECDDGVRLYVVQHVRDCDGTPLYNLSYDKDDVGLKAMYTGDGNFIDRLLHPSSKWMRHVSADYGHLEVIKLP